MNGKSALARRILAPLLAAILFLTSAGPYATHGTPSGGAATPVVHEERPQHGPAAPSAIVYLTPDPAEAQEDNDADPGSNRSHGRTRQRRRRPWPRRRGPRKPQESSDVS